MVVTMPLLLNLGVSFVLLFFSVHWYNSYGWFSLNWENFQRPDYSNKQKATNYHFYQWQNTNTANNEIFSGVTGLGRAPNTAAVPYPGAIWNYRCTGIFTSWWTWSPMLDRLTPASFLSCGHDTAAHFFRCTLYSHWHSAAILVYCHRFHISPQLLLALESRGRKLEGRTSLVSGLRLQYRPGTNCGFLV